MKNQIKLAAFHRIVLFVWVFVLVLALFPLTSNPVKPVKELASSVVVVLLAVSLLALPVKPDVPYDWQRMPVLFLCALWLLWGVVCTLLSDFKMAGLDEMRVYLTWFMIALFSARVFREPRQVHLLFLVICCAVFLSSVYGFMQFLGLDFFPWSTRDVEEYRGLPSTYANPNFAGHTLMLTLILGACLVAIKRMRWVVLLLILIGAHLYQTHMRGAPLALIAGCLLVLCALFTKKYIKTGAAYKPVWALFAVVVLGVAGVLALLPVSKMWTGFYFPTDGSLILRYNGYYGAANMVLDNPIIGVGPGNYGREAIAYWTPYEKRWFADQQKRNMRTHCDLLETATESGVPGLALHVALLMALLVRSLSLAFEDGRPEKRRIGYALAAFFMAFAVDGLFGFNLRVPVSGGLFFLMAGVLEGVSAPLPVSSPVPPPDTGKKKKNKMREQAPPEPEGQPRVFSSLVLCGVALFCLVGASVVFAGEIRYQRGNAAKIYEEDAKNEMYREQILKQGQEQLLAGRSLVFWDERYSDLLGHLAMRAGNTEAAVEYYSRALETDPHHPHKAANLARAYLSEALRDARDNVAPDYDRVGALLEEAQRTTTRAEKYCDISPFVQDVGWRIARARAVLAEEQGADALPHWREVAEKIRHSLQYGLRDVPGTYKALGMAYSKINEPEKALDPLAYVVDKDMKDESGWMLFETATRDSDNTGPILNALYKSHALALAGMPESEDLMVAMIRRLVNVYNDIEKDIFPALRFVRHDLTQVAHRTELWALFSGLAAGLGKPQLLCNEVAMHTASKSGGGNIPEVVRMMCSGADGQDGLGVASREIARASMHSAGQPAARDLAGLVDLLFMMLKGKTYPEEREAEIRANIATAYLEAGRWEEADTNFAYAIERLPENTHGRLMSARARALAGLGRSDEALALSARSVQMAPGDALVQLTYARLLRDAGRNEEAVFAYMAAVNGLPEASPLKKQAQRELGLLRGIMNSPAPEQGS